MSESGNVIRVRQPLERTLKQRVNGINDYFEQKFTSWLNIKLADIPDVLKQMGVEEVKYPLVITGDTASEIRVCVRTKTTKYFMKIRRGDMVNPYSGIDLVERDHMKSFYVEIAPEGKIKVTKICSFCRGKIAIE